MSSSRFERDPPQPDALGNPEIGLSDVLTRAASGEAEAWESLVAMYARRIYAAAKSRLSSPEAAEEIAQSVMTTVYQQLTSGRYRDDGRFESWLFRIVMNRVRDAARATSRQARLSAAVRHETGLRLAQDDRPADASGRLQAELRDAIGELPDADQEVLTLRHHAGLSFQTIAAMLEAPLGTVLARHHRAVAKLRARLQDFAGDLS